MRISEARHFLAKALPLKRRLLLVGKPGVGKTDIWQQACQMIQWDMITISMPLEDPATIRGYPSRGENGRATHCLFDGIARAMDAQGPTLLLGDDLGMASESTCKAWLRFTQFGEIDGRKLPDHVVIGCATNDTAHGAGVYGLIEPLKSRFHSIIPIETSVDDVVSYGLSRDWPTDLLAFLRNSPDSLHDWKPSKSMHNDGACPRTWEYVAQWINLGIDDPEVLAGCVGKGHATAYLAFRRLINELPDVDAIILSPDSAPVPSEPSARWLVSMALAGRMTAGNFGQCLEYLKRMPQTFRALSVLSAFKAEKERRDMGGLKQDHRPLSSSRDFTAWSVSEDGKEIRTSANT